MNFALTISRWRSAQRSAMATRMQSNGARAGGCFLTLFILLGFVYGLSRADPLGGSLIGLAVGAVLALLVWLFDRRRRLDDPAP